MALKGFTRNIKPLELLNEEQIEIKETRRKGNVGKSFVKSIPNVSQSSFL